MNYLRSWPGQTNNVCDMPGEEAVPGYQDTSGKELLRGVAILLERHVSSPLKQGRCLHDEVGPPPSATPRKTRLDSTNRASHRSPAPPAR